MNFRGCIFFHHMRKTLVDLYSKWLAHTGTHEDYRLALIDLYARFLRDAHRKTWHVRQRVSCHFESGRPIFAENSLQNFAMTDTCSLLFPDRLFEIVEAYNRDYLHFDTVIGSVYEGATTVGIPV